METVRTKTSISITVKYGSGDYFKIETELSNETGISDVEIDNELAKVQRLVVHAIEDYKKGEKIIKDNMPTFDPDKNLEELLQKAHNKTTKK